MIRNFAAAMFGLGLLILGVAWPWLVAGLDAAQLSLLDATGVAYRLPPVIVQAGFLAMALGLFASLWPRQSQVTGQVDGGDESEIEECMQPDRQPPIASTPNLDVENAGQRVARKSHRGRTRKTRLVQYDPSQ